MSLRHRPIFGGVFGQGRYSLATMPCLSNGLHAVRYMVIEPKGGAVLSVAEGKLDALASARKVLRATETLAKNEVPLGEQASLWPEEDLPVIGSAPRPISRRRRDVFERSNGRCHYCSSVLKLDGKWHIEHMVPKALDGTDDEVNLVAACVACNLAKSDQTALEFISKLQPRLTDSGKASEKGAATPISD